MGSIYPVGGYVHGIFVLNLSPSRLGSWLTIPSCCLVGAIELLLYRAIVQVVVKYRVFPAILVVDYFLSPFGYC